MDFVEAKISCLSLLKKKKKLVRLNLKWAFNIQVLNIFEIKS